MKKIFIAAILLLAFSANQTLEAQAYIRAGAGAGFGVTKDAFAIPALTRNDQGIVVSQRTIFGSFGQGTRFALAGGYMITPNFGVELEFYYFNGFKQEYGSELQSNGTNYIRTGYSYQVRATPSLVVQAETGKFKPYARFGVLLPLMGQTIIEENWTYANQKSREKQTNVDGKFSVGLESSMGVVYSLTENLGIYIEATFTGLRIKSDKAEVVKDVDIDTDGSQIRNNIENAQAFLTNIRFQDEMTLESNYLGFLSNQLPAGIVVNIDPPLANFDYDKPLDLPTQTSNFAALSLSLGVKYTFVKK